MGVRRRLRVAPASAARPYAAAGYGDLMGWSLTWRHRPRSYALFLGLPCSAAVLATLFLFLLGVIGFPAGASDSRKGASSFSPIEDTYVKSTQSNPSGREVSL